MILDRIVAYKKKQIENEKRLFSMEQLKQKIIQSNLPPTADFLEAIRKKDEISIIAEVKKASPSKGIICHDFDPVKIASEYYNNNVSAISVLTESQFFMGSDDYLKIIRQNVPTPLLRKDFIIDVWQIYQARLLGADAILLIVSILSDEELKKFHIVANILGMKCLVETHNEKEIERALAAGAEIIGINNRDLQTFYTTLEVTAKLKTHIPDSVAVVSESGIKDHSDMKYLKNLDVNAVLIGETLVRQQNITEKIKELRYG